MCGLTEEPALTTTCTEEVKGKKRISIPKITPCVLTYGTYNFQNGIIHIFNTSTAGLVKINHTAISTLNMICK